MVTTKTNVVNIKYEAYQVYIGRGSPYGNRWTHIKHKPTKAQFLVDSIEESIAKYQEWVLGQPDLLKKIRQELTGKTLGCFCKPGPCHGDVLVKICNGEL